MRSRIVIWLFVVWGIAGQPLSASAITGQELKARVEAATKDFKDIDMLGTVVESDMGAIEKVEPSYARLYELKSAKISLKTPDKLRIEGKLGMVKFEYIINDGVKITRAPMVRFKKREDYKNDPAKLQEPLDIGLITPTIWRKRSVEIVDDAEATRNSEILLRLRWIKAI